MNKIFEINPRCALFFYNELSLSIQKTIIDSLSQIQDLLMEFDPKIFHNFGLDLNSLIKLNLLFIR